ncbi:MAG: TIGR00341 family protein [Muribaculaceae bacterium]
MVFKEIKRYLHSYFDLSNDLESEKIAAQSIIDGVSFKGGNIIILIIAIIIASLGLNTNSAAVIIGAMLISPLMGPIMGMGYGLGTYDFDLIKRSFRNIAMAAVFSVIASTLYFLISPVNEGRSELLARTSPTIYDVFIGFFGGAAGIVAIACKQKGNVLPGVAIATALMPPLCTAGYGLATWQLEYFFGAFYLFLINSIFIAFATTIGVKFLKFKPHAFINPERKKRVERIVYAIITLTLLPSIWLTFLMLRENFFTSDANKFITEAFVFPNTQVLNKDSWISNGERHIKVTLIGAELPKDSLQLAMQAKLVKAGLDGTKLDIQQGFALQNSVSAEDLSSAVFKDIYQSNIEKIAMQATKIDSLTHINRTYNKFDSVSIALAPEIKVLFPAIKDFAISRSVFCDIAENKADTVNIALIKYSNKMPMREQQKFKEYIEARVGLKNVHIIENSIILKFTNPLDKNNIK